MELQKGSCDTPLTRAFNTAGRRFERGFGHYNIKNDLLNFKPVRNCYFNVQ